MKKILSLLSIAALGFLSSCYYDNMEELFPADPLSKKTCDSLKTVSFSADIKPFMQSSCGTTNSCHGPGSAIVDLSNYTNLKSKADAGTLMKVIYWEPGASQMPKGATQRIDVCSRAMFKNWINAGAPEN